MKLKHIPLAITLIALPVPAFAGAVVFGDSLTDTGNRVLIDPAAAGAVAALPTYQNGTFSNGVPALVQALANSGNPVVPSEHHLGAPVGTNYSVASARISVPEHPFSLTLQVDSYLSTNPDLGDQIYFWIGVNDLRDIAQNPDTCFGEKADAARAVVDAFKVEVDKLVAYGITDITILNLPDLSSIPEVSYYETVVEDYAKNGKRLTKIYNGALRSLVRTLNKDQGANARIIDINDAWDDILDDAERLGFVSASAHCIYLLIPPAPGYPTAECAAGVPLDNLPFVDEVHPSGAFHTRLGLYLQSLMP